MDMLTFQPYSISGAEAVYLTMFMKLYWLKFKPDIIFILYVLVL